MAVYQFSALSDGQAISFNPAADVLNFDQSVIAAADIRVTASGANTRIDVVAGSFTGKDIVLLNVSPLQLATTNVRFADSSQLLIGDNSTALNDNAANRLAGTSGRDLLMGLGGNDTFVGGSGGADVIDGGAGFDSIEFGSAATSAVVVDYGAGTITGGGPGSISFTSIERIVGSNFNDRMTGNAGGQNLTGQAGADTLWGAGGADTLWGGAGADTFIFRETGTANADLVRDFASGSDKFLLDGAVMSALGASGNFAAGDARFWAAAGATGGHDADDRVIYNSTTLQVFYDADGSGSGAAVLIGTLQTGATLVATDIVVEGGSTTPAGPTEGDDSLVGTAGNDTINGLGGNDTIDGLAGNDSLVGGAGTDVLIGGDGNDILDGDNASFGATDVDIDMMRGGLGDDTYRVDNAADVLAEAGGIDTVVAINVDWTLGDGFENLHLHNEREGAGSQQTGIGNALDNEIIGNGDTFLEGRGGNDTIHGGLVDHIDGGDGDDVLRGFERSDTLIGGAGNDLLEGWSGLNVLTGGAGVDSFVFSVTPAPGDYDSLSDFASGIDKLRFDARAFTQLGASGNFSDNDGRFYAAPGAIGGHDENDRIIFNTSTGEVFYDSDGGGSVPAQLVARLQPGATLGASDIAVDNGTEGQTINGGPGNDSLRGGDGNDTINGFGGNDTLDGWAGNDRLDGGTGNDSLFGNEGADLLIGGDGNDTLDGLASRFAEYEPDIDTLVGGLGDDLFVVDNPADVLSDTGGVDTIVAHNMGWTLGPDYENLAINNGEVESRVDGIGNELDNILDGSNGEGPSDGWHVYLEGRGGNDLILGSVQNDTLLGGDGDDTIRGGGDYDILEGGAGNDLLDGWYSLDGGTGNDTLIGGNDGELDFLTGGAGADIFIFNKAPNEFNNDQVSDFASDADHIRLDARVMPNLGPSGTLAPDDGRFYAAAGATGGNDADDRIVYNTSNGQLYYDPDGNGAQAAQGIAGLSLNGTAAALAASDITVDNGTSGGMLITGTAGNDSLVGGAGNDTINGLAGNDTLLGNGGNDSLDGGTGTDSMDGGLGNDTYVVTAGDVLTDGGGIDTVVTDITWSLGLDFENLTMTGTAGIQMQGNNSNNFVIGNAGNNYFNTRAGSDTVQAGGGNDTIDMSSSGTGSHGNDVIDGGAAFDSIDFDGYATRGIIANFNTGTISGGDAAGSSVSFTNVEVIVGGAFADQMTGNGAGQNLTGKGGNDTLWGAGGADTLWGGTGADSFVFREMGTVNADRIGDFASASDKVSLDDIAFTSIGAAGNFSAGDARWRSGAGVTTGQDASDRVIYNTSTGSLYYDADGSGAGASLLIATFTGNPAIAATDIAVI